ncbi:MAG: hypothetical protein LUF82_06645 [Clostridia bacterium]|nr:hypothetical protein [Clostridia bacterium]
MKRNAMTKGVLSLIIRYTSPTQYCDDYCKFSEKLQKASKTRRVRL